MVSVLRILPVCFLKDTFPEFTDKETIAYKHSVIHMKSHKKSKIQTEICLIPGPLNSALYLEKHYIKKKVGKKGSGELKGQEKDEEKKEGGIIRRKGGRREKKRGISKRSLILHPINLSRFRKVFSFEFIKMHLNL